MKIEKKTLRQIFIGAVACILLIWALYHPASVLMVIKRIGRLILPFAIGASIAFVLNVPMRFIERFLKFIKKDGLRRGTAIVLTIIALILILALVVLLLVPPIIEATMMLADMLPGFVTEVIDLVNHFLNEHPDLLDMVYRYTDFENINWAGILQSVFTLLKDKLTETAGIMYDLISNISTGIFNAVVSIVFSFYCLFRKEILARQARRVLYSFLSEKVCDEVIRIARMVNTTFSRFISGQCLEAVIIGLMFAIAMSIFRMPFTPLVSLVIAITSLVPIVGAFIGCFVGAFFILVQDPMMAVWFVVMFLIIQQIEGNLIYPRVMGTSVGLPGMWVLVAVGIGADLMGILGMVVMIPVVTVLYELAREITNKRLAARGIPREKLQYYPQEITSKFKEKRQSRKEKRSSKKEKDSISKTDAVKPEDGEA